jgi:hypothetical protein
MHMELAADPVKLVSEAGHGLLPQRGTIEVVPLAVELGRRSNA